VSIYVASNICQALPAETNVSDPAAAAAAPPLAVPANISVGVGTAVTPPVRCTTTKNAVPAEWMCGCAQTQWCVVVCPWRGRTGTLWANSQGMLPGLVAVVGVHCQPTGFSEWLLCGLSVC
jgi:hypothetical protein